MPNRRTWLRDTPITMSEDLIRNNTATPENKLPINQPTMTEGNRQPQSEQLKELKQELEKYPFALEVEIDELQSENERLKSALTQSVELIKQWKQKAVASSGKSREVIEEIWLEYYEHSPEMKLIREALKHK